MQYNCTLASSTIRNKHFKEYNIYTIHFTYMRLRGFGVVGVVSDWGGVACGVAGSVLVL